MKASEADRLHWERRLWAKGVRSVAGVDEAGRGPLAGPVVAAAVILPVRWSETGAPDPEFADLNDSKQLNAAAREAFFERLVNHPEIRFALGWAEAEEIDRLNILRATHRAMQRAIAALQPPPDHVLVDGRPVPGLSVPHTALVRGDARSYSIAAASILAKVTRDLFMRDLDRKYPLYGFAEHKGYPTPRHLAALAQWGPCPAHRRSFAPVRERQLEWQF
jgi:ribonuclease HII